MKINPFRNQTTVKKEPIHYIKKRGRINYAKNQGSQRNWGWFSGRPYPRGQQNTRGQEQPQRNTNFNTQKQCYKCGNKFGENRLQSCPQRTKFVRNVQNGDTSPKYAVQETSIIWGTAMMRNNRGKLRRRVKKRTTIQKHLPNLHQIMVGMNTKLISFRYWQIRKLSKLKNTANVSEDGLSGHIDKFKTKTEELFAIADSGNPLSFLNEKTARRLQEIHKSSFF